MLSAIEARLRTLDNPPTRFSAICAVAALIIAMACLSADADAKTRPERCQAGPAKVEEVASGVFVRIGTHALMSAANHGGIANTGFVIGKSGVAVIDTGGSACDGLALHRAIRARTPLPIRYVVNTHVHPDHVFGNAAFLSDKPIFVGHRNLPRAMAARGAHYLKANRRAMGIASLEGTKIIPPQVLVKDRLTLKLGDRNLELSAWKASHTDQDLTIFDAMTATLFAGDLLFSGHIPILDGNLKGWLEVMKRLSAIKARRVVPGHGPISMNWPDALAPQTRYLKTLAADVRASIRNGETMSVAVAKAGLSENGKWYLFGEFNMRNATAAFAELEWE